VKSLGPVNVKGLPEPVEVYEVTGVGATRSRLQAAAARGLTRFVGRNAEMEQLWKALEQARADHGQVVGVVGEPGLGKSRLFFEFIHSHRTQGWLILESGSVSYGKATPYLPVIDLLKAYFKIQDRDDQREIREKVTAKLLTLDKANKQTLYSRIYSAEQQRPLNQCQVSGQSRAHNMPNISLGNYHSPFFRSSSRISTRSASFMLRSSIVARPMAVTPRITASWRTKWSSQFSVRGLKINTTVSVSESTLVRFGPLWALQSGQARARLLSIS
jgi:AAA ATPase domain